MRLPRRPAALQRAFHEAAGPGVEVRRRGVQPDVVERVEVRVGLAGGAAEGEGAAQCERRLPGVPDPHPQAGHRGGAGREQVGGVGARGGRAGREDAERAEVHGVRGGLDVPERQVEGSERIGSQGRASQGRRVNKQSIALRRLRSSTIRLRTVNSRLKSRPWERGGTAVTTGAGVLTPVRAAPSGARFPPGRLRADRGPSAPVDGRTRRPLRRSGSPRGRAGTRPGSGPRGRPSPAPRPA